MTLKDVKSVTGMSTGNISDIERGVINPSSNALIAFSNIYNVSCDYILKGTNDNNSEEDTLLSKIKKLNAIDREDIELMIDLKLKRYDKQSSSISTDTGDKVG
jgi:transcriptional regulator with XRE-family HTH domain